MTIINTINNFRISTIDHVAGVDDTRALITNESGKDKGLVIEYEYAPREYLIVTFLKIEDKDVKLQYIRDTILDFEQDELLDWQMVCNEAMSYLRGILEVITSD